MNNKAAIYLRSSKDRSDVSIAAQRRDLHQLATERDLLIVDEFVDAVESGKTENRPGFQSLVDALKSTDRSWSSLIMLDTSRLSRRQFISNIFEHEAEKQGVALIYKSLPDADPISSMMLKAILQAMDQWHSMVSKQKGLAGMEENVRQGYRAGGKAPRGYRLHYIETGTIRDGKAVKKSRLIPNDDADKVAKLLKLRAKGVARSTAHRQLGITWSVNTTIGMEWNALTYAGHTVWNVMAERRDGKAIGGKRRKPISEWKITENTHTALITQQEADTILYRLHTRTPGSAKLTSANYLLTGLLYDTTGQRLHGDSHKFYRMGKKRRFNCKKIDNAVLNKVQTDLKSPKIINKLTKQIKEQSKNITTKKRAVTNLNKKVAAISKKIDKTIDLISLAHDPKPYMHHVEQLDQQRQQIQKQIDDTNNDISMTSSMQHITEGDIRILFEQLANKMLEKDRESLKDFLRLIIEKITIESSSNPLVTIYYKIPSSGANVASPRGFEPLLPP